MKAKDQYQNNNGTVATIDYIRGNKVFFTTSGLKGVTDMISFKTRFPRKV